MECVKSTALASLVVACCFSATLARAQILVGFDSPLPPGPHPGLMGSPVSGGVTIGAPSGPVAFGFSESGPTWTKNLSFDISETGIGTGAQLTLTEHLQWTGSGPSPFTDWHESIQGENFVWQTGGVISIGPSNGLLSNGNKDITFNFPPQSSPLTFQIQKTLIYTGPPITAGPGATIGVTIVEQPSVPEPAGTAAMAAGALLLWSVARRRRASVAV